MRVYIEFVCATQPFKDARRYGRSREKSRVVSPQTLHNKNAVYPRNVKYQLRFKIITDGV